MINWKQVDVNSNRTAALKEDVRMDMKQQDMTDTQDEMFKLDRNMWNMVKDLTVENRQELNKKIREFCDECKKEEMMKMMKMGMDKDKMEMTEK